MLLVQLEEAVLAAFEAGRTNRSGGDEDCSEPRWLPAHSSWQCPGHSGDRPGVALLSLLLQKSSEPSSHY